MFRIMFRVMLEKHSLEKQLLECWRIFGKVDKIIVTGTVGNIIGRFFLQIIGRTVRRMVR